MTIRWLIKKNHKKNDMIQNIDGEHEHNQTQRGMSNAPEDIDSSLH